MDQLAEWREESERRCDEQRQKLRPAEVNEPDSDVAVEAAGEVRSASEIDARVRALAAELARRDVELGRLATWLQRAEAWRRLGFASEAHYVRERMGVSYSQWKLRRHVSRQLGDFSEVEAALARGDIGLEAASLLMRACAVVREQLREGPPGNAQVPGNELALSDEQLSDEQLSEHLWLERARRRTFKHLREEVLAAELAAQQAGVLALPPSEETMRRLRALEGRVKSGAVLLESDSTAESRLSVAGIERRGCAAAESRLSVAGRAWLDLRGELRGIWGAFLGDPGEPLATREPNLGRARAVRLRLRLERDTLVEFRCLERLYRRQHVGGFLEFLCRHFLAVWAPAMLTDVRYAHVYRRDAFTCSSPVCERHDVQPHHLKFRSAGGGEEDENLTALCTWCHLEGVHGGRLQVKPPASRMHWRIGPGLLELHGRELVR